MNFEDIRPYNDDEVKDVVTRLIRDTELHDTLVGMKYPRLARWLPWLVRPQIRRRLEQALADVDSVAKFQRVIAHYWWPLLESQTRKITVSGLDQIDPNQPCLYICNHRDIAMDPAVVGLSLDRAGRDTTRIAIGDNLLSKPFVSDLMRLNKSFIVKRSVAGRREKMDALKQLSAYIRHSITTDRCSIWIAQREGRAKDGLDRTDTALIKMLALSKQSDQTFAEAMAELHIVPVSISYEYDPCDAAKARELYATVSTGGYKKQKYEDLKSIYDGITGKKGHIHVAFSDELQPDEIESADTVAAAIDQHIIQHYYQHPTNLIAYQQLHGDDSRVDELRQALAMSEEQWAKAASDFNQRLQAIPAEYRDIARAIYANPVVSRLALQRG